MKRLKGMFAFLIVVSVIAPLFTADVSGQQSGSDEIEFLIKSAKDQSWQVRWDAAAALGETKDPRAIKPLSAALKDENSYVRMTAARSLGLINDPRVIEPLIGALKDESHGVKKNAVLSLKKITGKDFGKDYAKWQQWWEQNK